MRRLCRCVYERPTQRVLLTLASAFRRQSHNNTAVYLSSVVATMGKSGGGKRQYYAVVRGRTPGVYRSWEECEREVRGFKGNLYKGFSEEGEAKAFMQQNLMGETGKAMESNPGVNLNFNSNQREATSVIRSNIPKQSLRPPLSKGSVVRMEFDGAAKGNPGPAGFGVAFYDEDSGQQIGQLYRYIGHTGTNNQAEYAGLVAGLHAALEAGYRHCLAQGDSTLIINQVMGRWKVRNESLMPFHAAASLLLKQFESFSARQVPRKFNAMADSLANLAINEWNASHQNPKDVWTLDAIHDKDTSDCGGTRMMSAIDLCGSNGSAAEVKDAVARTKSQIQHRGQKRPLSEDTGL
jgi:ribonuclease HI